MMMERMKVNTTWSEKDEADIFGLMEGNIKEIGMMTSLVG